MATPTQDPDGYYVWEPASQPVVVHLRWEVVDRLAAEAMGGFGSVPKRGAEVGGVLIGTARPGVPAVIRVEDFEPVACEYRRGPSYLFADEDIAAFADCCRRWKRDTSPTRYAVGYFRSHTRDGFSLEPEDLGLMDHFFPADTGLALLIKPYATKVSVGGFFVREQGAFPAETPLEFPLRRHELSGEPPKPRRPLTEERSGGRTEARMPPSSISQDAPPPRDSPRYDDAPPARSSRSAWVWFPLTFLFLLLGVALGYQLALTIGARAAAQSAQDFSLSLSVNKIGDNLKITWSRESPAVRYARKGILEIQDGADTKPVDLDTAQLQNGSLTYHTDSKSVRFRLTVYPQGRVSIAETLEWKE